MDFSHLTWQICIISDPTENPAEDLSITFLIKGFRN
jgi:hypothetical protein